MEQTLFRHKNILFRLLSQPAYRDIFPYKHAASKYYVTIKTFFMQAAHFHCSHNHLKSICFRTELQLEVEQLYTNY